MSTIRPNTKPIHWYVTRGDERLSGHTPLGALTGISPEAVTTSAEGETNLLAAMADVAGALPPLPDSGELEAGALYRHNGQAIMVRQSHIRTEHDPADVPALFWTVNSTTNWIAGERVEIGTRRTFEGTEYDCIQAHTTQEDWTPPAVPALWRAVVAPSEAWTAGVTYKVGDEAAYEGTLYRCRQAHTAQVGWEPPGVPALWEAVI